MTCPRPLSCVSAFQRLHEVSLDEETHFTFQGAGGIILIVWMGLPRGWEWEGVEARDGPRADSGFGEGGRRT